MKVFRVLRRVVHNSDAVAQSLREAVVGIANQTAVENRKLQAILAGLDEQTRLLDRKLERLAFELAKRSDLPGQNTNAAAAATAVADDPAPPSPRQAWQPPLRNGAATTNGAGTGRNAAPPRAGQEPSGEIPYPRLDLRHLSNPIPALIASEEFDASSRYFLHDATTERSLVNDDGRALIHALIRNQKPTHAVEIGTYRGGTTEVMARAMQANGVGTLHTVGPFDADAFRPVYERWPRQLQQIVRYYPTDSMAFFMELESQGIRPDLVFIDGHHDYEFALFDLLCAARRLTPGGFIILDDSDQAGPYFAARDFMARQPDWIDCVSPNRSPPDRTRAFDPNRTHVAGTNFVVLRAPTHYQLIDDRPRTFGEMAWQRPEVHGVVLSLDGRQERGAVHVQCILRGFGEGPQLQVSEAGSTTIDRGVGEVEVTLSQPIVVEEPVDRRTLEAWVVWTGKGPLRLTTVPTPF
jgi:predicted O-methyltransferase YrrM